jgi:hypothetical protein
MHSCLVYILLSIWWIFLHKHITVLLFSLFIIALPATYRTVAEAKQHQNGKLGVLRPLETATSVCCYWCLHIVVLVWGMNIQFNLLSYKLASFLWDLDSHSCTWSGTAESSRLRRWCWKGDCLGNIAADTLWWVMTHLSSVTSLLNQVSKTPLLYLRNLMLAVAYFSPLRVPWFLLAFLLRVENKILMLWIADHIF